MLCLAKTPVIALWQTVERNLASNCYYEYVCTVKKKKYIEYMLAMSVNLNSECACYICFIHLWLDYESVVSELFLLCSGICCLSCLVLLARKSSRLGALAVSAGKLKVNKLGFSVYIMQGINLDGVCSYRKRINTGWCNAEHCYHPKAEYFPIKHVPKCFPTITISNL